jgi:hypothetical protein
MRRASYQNMPVYHSHDLHTYFYWKYFILQGDSGGPLLIDGERGFMETVGK